MARVEMVELELGMTVCRRGYDQPCVIVGLNRNLECVRVVPLPYKWECSRFMNHFYGQKSFGRAHADAYAFPGVEKPVQVLRLNIEDVELNRGSR